MAELIPWACPKCGAGAHEHGKGGHESCEYTGGAEGGCEGLICECPDDCAREPHGQAFDNPCTEANCHHCGWGGTLPVKPKGLATWERKALAAGWSPPKGRLR